MTLLWLVACFKVGPVPGASERVATRHEVDARAHPDAVCNDGSVPVYYVRRGAERDRWVVWLMGGGACSTEADCAARSRTLKSAEPWRRVASLDGRSDPIPPDSRLAGILSADPAQNPDFHGWNHVVVPYCTSDLWTGDRGASAETFGLHFRGRRVFDAVIDGLDLQGAERVILAGSSAGAAGVRANVDRLAKQLRGVDVRAFSDAAISPEVTPARTEPEDVVSRRNFEVWGARPDDSCAEALGKEAWRCLEGRVVADGGHLATPTFWRMDQRDPIVMGESPGATPGGFELSRQAAGEIRAIIGRQEGGFCPASANHVVLNFPLFATEKIDGHSVAEVFGNWYFDRAGPKRLVDAGTGGARRR